MKQCFMDFILDPKAADSLTTKIVDIGYGYYKKLIEAVKPYIRKKVVAI